MSLHWEAASCAFERMQAGALGWMWIYQLAPPLGFGEHEAEPQEWSQGIQLLSACLLSGSSQVGIEVARDLEVQSKADGQWEV